MSPSFFRLTPVRRAAAGCSCWSSRSARSPPPSRRRARASTRTIRSRASRSRRTPRRRTRRHRLDSTRCSTTCSSTPGYKPSRHARAEHQHDRRSARLELVHQPRSASTRSALDDTSARSATSAPRRIRRSWVLIAREDGRRASGLHRPRRQGRDLVPRVRPASIPEGATAAVAIATKIFWALGYNQVESFITHLRSEEGGDRSEGDGPAPSGARTTVHARRHQRHSGDRGQERGRHLPRHRRPPDSRQDPRQLPLSPARGPTIPTISCRTSTGASCGRCASSAPGPT